MNYVWRKDSIWLTATRQRKRIPAIKARPRVAVTITSRSTNIGIPANRSPLRATAMLHKDTKTNEWMNAELANAIRPNNTEQARALLLNIL